MLRLGVELSRDSATDSLLHDACFPKSGLLTADGMCVAPEGVEIVEALLSQGANPNARNDKKLTPLHWLVTERDHNADGEKVMRLLVRRGADVNAAADYYTWGGVYHDATPLHCCAVNRYRPATVAWAMLLIELGAGVNARAREGKTPLAIAVANKHEAVAKLLRESGGVE